VPEALALPQVEARGMVRRLGRPEGLDREVAVVLSGFTIAGAEPAVSGPPPRLGQDTEAVLKGLGYSADEIAAMRERGDI
jgi:crotonobetainyl-CoA:carnitine CoA-transferase CaiB-like acyl-CoA transferase